MKQRKWIILGATSLIAKAFAHLAAAQGHSLILAGRHSAQLQMIAADLRLRHRIECESLVVDFTKSLQELILLVQDEKQEFDLFIAHALGMNNETLTEDNISRLLTTNIMSTASILHTYWQKKQKEQRIIFLSSVAACRGRAKNSLYGGSKAAIEIYLEGLQQESNAHQHITIARLGFIDTRLTYGEAGIFHASSPEKCAKACWSAVMKGKRLIYHPWFWQEIMWLIVHLPFFLFKKFKSR